MTPTHPHIHTLNVHMTLNLQTEGKTDSEKSNERRKRYCQMMRVHVPATMRPCTVYTFQLMQYVFTFQFRQVLRQ